MNKRLIEYDLPLADISEASAREKNIRHGHPSTLHIWWARRPLASSRAAAFAALISDPSPDHPLERKEPLEILKRTTCCEAAKNSRSNRIQESKKLIRYRDSRSTRIQAPLVHHTSLVCKVPVRSAQPDPPSLMNSFPSRASDCLHKI